MQSISLFLLEIRAAARRPLLLFVCLLTPFLLLGFLASALAGFANGEGRSIEVAVVDQDKTFETKSLVNQLQEDKTLAQQLKFVEMDEHDAKQAVQDGELTGVVLIPEGFTTDLRNGNNTPIEVRLDDQRPLESGVLQLLLDSAASYISAAQSGVNAVYHTVIKPLEDSEERGRLLQQVIVTFTLEALDRNDLFHAQTVEQGAAIGWEKHGILAVWMLGSWLSISLFIGTRQSLLHGSVSDRLRSMHILRSHVHIAQVALFSIFLFIGTQLFFAIYGAYNQGETSQGLFFHLLMACHAILQAGSAALFLALFKNRGQAALWHVLLSLPMLLASGILIPYLYLPSWLQQWSGFLPWHHIYEGIHQLSYGFLFVPSGWGIALIVTGWLINRKVEKRNVGTV